MKRDIIKHYDALAPVYDFRIATKIILHYLQNLIKESRLIEKKSTLLDLGCGTGPMLSLWSSAKRIVGCDISIKTLKKARKKIDTLQKYDLVVCDGEHLPFLSETFDIIVCTDVIEHTENPSKLLMEIAYILKMKGKLLLSFPNAFWKPLSFVFEKLRIKCPEGISRDLSPIAFEEMLRNKRLEIIERRGVIYPPYGIKILEKFLEKINEKFGKGRIGKIFMKQYYIIRKI